MKILVIGSFRSPHPSEKPTDKPDEKFIADHKLRFEAACRALGEALVRRDHLVMVGVPDWSMLQSRNTVANFIVEGANKAPLKDKKKNSLVFYGPQEPEPEDKTRDKTPDSLMEFKKLEHLDIKDKYVGSGVSKARMIPNVADVDAVMLISGREGTESIGYAAYSMEKPVIAITAFRGAAESISKEVLLQDYSRFLKQEIVNENDLRALDVQWDEDENKDRSQAEAVVDATEKLVKAYGQARKKTLRVLKWTIGLLVLLLFGWVGFYLSAYNASNLATPKDFLIQISFFVLLYISSLLGSGLRTLVSYQENRIAQLTFLGLGIDAAISLLVAFGLALIYLIGGISFTGKVVVLQPAGTGVEKYSAFTTVAISMSLLGLAAGYLVPLKKLTERLANIVNQENK
jgi:hypothetical protein